MRPGLFHREVAAVMRVEHREVLAVRPGETTYLMY